MDDKNDKKMTALVERYQQRLLLYKNQLQELASDLSSLQCKKINHIKQLAHRLAGSGKAFNFPDISRIAKQLETYCELLEQSPNPNDALQLKEVPFAHVIELLLNELETAAQAKDQKTTEQVAAQQAAKQQKPAAKNDMTLLIIDDDNEFSALLSHELTEYGYQTHFLTDIGQLSHAIAQNQPDAILVDMEFYGDQLAGASKVSQWKEQSGYPLPVIFISAHDGFAVRFAAVKAGGHHFLNKPVDMPRLTGLLRKELGITEQASPFRILLVDDDEDLLQLYQSLLLQEGYTVFSATCAEQALQLLDEVNPELVLVDIFMPECSGLELGHLIRQHEAHYDTAILFMSSSADTDIKLAGARLSQDEFITKPIEPWRLRMVIKSRAAQIRRRTSRQLTYDGTETSGFDRLTALPTDQALRQRIEAALQQHCTAAVLKLDIRNFHTINNLYGPFLGDQLLQAIAWRLSEAVLEQGSVYRAGGDDFYVFIDQLNSAEQIHKVVKGIGDCFAAKYQLDTEQSISVAADIGVMLRSAKLASVETMIAHVDTALFEAKSHPAPSIVYFDAAMLAMEEQRFNLAQALEQAFLKKEFTPFYQPIFTVNQQQVAGFEALVRWQHPERGLVGPGDFIPALENSGLVTELTALMLQDALSQLAHWQKTQPDLFMSINLSAHDIESPSFLDVLAGLIERDALNPQSVVLEITETTLLANWQLSSQVIASIKKMGVKLALDDFGTGFSSLNYLNRIQADKLKIDRSFIDAWSKSGDARLLSTMVQLGKGMEMAVVAEGVEQQEELRFLQALECDFYQGYLSARPLPPADIESRFINASLSDK